MKPVFDGKERKHSKSQRSGKHLRNATKLRDGVSLLTSDQLRLIRHWGEPRPAAVVT